MQVRIAAGTIDITPQKPICLFGFSHRKEPVSKVFDPLEINAIVLRQNDKHVALMSVDLLWATLEVKRAILSEVNSEKITEESFFLGASHTHFAPAIDSSKPQLGKADQSYVDFVIEKAASLLKRLLDDKGTFARLRYGKINVPLVVNRRRKDLLFGQWWKPVHVTSISPNPKGPKSETLHTVIAETLDKKPVAMLWNYGCHPVIFPDQKTVTAEYPGKVRKRVRAFFDKTLPTLFFQGFAGNIRSSFVGEIALPWARKLRLRDRISRFINGPAFGLYSFEQYEKWTDELAKQVISFLEQDKCDFFEVELGARRLEVPLNRFLTLADDNEVISFQRIDLSSDLSIVGISAEPMTEYVECIKSVFYPRRVIPVGCIDTVFGYLPTQRIANEGGYEGNIFLKLFDRKGTFTKEVEIQTIEALKELASVRNIKA